MSWAGGAAVTRFVRSRRTARVCRTMLIFLVLFPFPGTAPV